MIRFADLLLFEHRKTNDAASATCSSVHFTPASRSAVRIVTRPVCDGMLQDVLCIIEGIGRLSSPEAARASATVLGKCYSATNAFKSRRVS